MAPDDAATPDAPTRQSAPQQLWPRYETEDDLPAIDAVPLSDRGMPATSYAALVRAAELWPDRPAATVLSSAERWRNPHTLTFAQLLADVRRYANLLHTLGVGRHTAVALMSTNTAQFIPALLAAQLAGIAAPVNPGLSTDHIGQLLRRGGARLLIAAGPDLAPEIWDRAQRIAAEQQLDAVLALRPPDATATAAQLTPVDGVRVGYLDDADDVEQTAGALPPGSSDLAAFFLIGGHTGTPQIAAHTP